VQDDSGISPQQPVHASDTSYNAANHDHSVVWSDGMVRMT
jgi:hypothetical protein